MKLTASPQTVVASVVEKLTEEVEAKLAETKSVEDVAVETEQKKAEREATKEATGENKKEGGAEAAKK